MAKNALIAPSAPLQTIVDDDATKRPLPDIELEVTSDAVTTSRPRTAATMDDEDVQPFPDDIDHEKEGQTTLDANVQAQFERDHKMVWIRPRRNLTRTKIGPDWHTFEKGKEYQIAQWKADWLMEQGYL